MEEIKNAEVINGVIIKKPEEDINHLSPSQINTFESCPAKWKYRYIDGLKIPPSSALTLGSSFDDGVSTNYYKKIDTKEDMPVEDVVDAFVTSFNKRDVDTDWARGESKDNIKDIGIGLIREYQKVIAPNIIPVAIQGEYNVSFPGVEWTLKMFTDIETADNTIVDNKTTAKSPPKDEDGNYKALNANHEFQMLCYSIGKKQRDGGTFGDKLRLDYAVKTKTPKIISVTLPVPNTVDFKFFQNKTATVYQHMELLRADKLRPLANRTHNLCSRRFCGYWSVCEKDHGGRVKL